MVTIFAQAHTNKSLLRHIYLPYVVHLLWLRIQCLEGRPCRDGVGSSVFYLLTSALRILADPLSLHLLEMLGLKMREAMLNLIYTISVKH